MVRSSFQGAAPYIVFLLDSKPRTTYDKTTLEIYIETFRDGSSSAMRLKSR